MIWWMLLIWLVVATVAADLLAPKPKFGSPQPGGLDDFNAPTAQEGRAIPIAWGTVKIAGPNITWWGDLIVAPIVEKVKTGIFSSTKITKGYKYYLGIMYAICWGPVDALIGINFGNKGGDLSTMPYNAGSVSVLMFDFQVTKGILVTDLGNGESQLDIYENDIFGGDQQEGGVVGRANFYTGTQTQTGNDYLAAKWGMSAAPAFKGLCYAVLRKIYVGTTTYIKPWAWIIQRTPDSLGMGNGHHKIQAPYFNTSYTGAGTGTITGISAGGSIKTEVYTMKATGPSSFAVRGSVTGAIGTATVGTPFTSAYINFTINSGSVAFSAQDRFTIAIDGKYDANPICAIYEILTNSDWGLGFSPTLIDSTTFLAAAERCYSDGVGISMVVSDSSSAGDLIAEICRHVDGTIYGDVTTGKLCMVLARNDYDVSTLIELNPSNVSKEGFTFTRGSWATTQNEVKIQYTDRSRGYVQGEEQAQELANQRTQGVTVSTTIQFKGLSNPSAANFVAIRALKTLSYPLARVHLQCSRLAWNLHPGSVFKLNWTPLGLPVLIMRVNRISYGELRGRPMVEIDAVEDIFSVATTAYTPGGSSNWDDPSTQPPAAWTAEQLMETPYFWVGQERWVMTMALRGDSTTMGYNVWTDDGYGYYYVEQATQTTPSGVLLNNYAANTADQDETGFVVDLIGDSDQLLGVDATRLLKGDSMLLIDNELIAWRDWTPDPVIAGRGTIKGAIRGALDTVPADHSAGARVWFITNGVNRTSQAAYIADQTVKAKLVQFSTRQSADLASATELTLVTTSRAWKPYPPGGLQVNGANYPVTTISDAVLTWNHRNRVSQVGILKQSDASDPAGPEGTYTVEVYVGGVLKRTFSSLTGTTQTYTCAQRASDDTDGTKTVVMKIRPINGSYEGTSHSTSAFTMTGLGMTLGQYLGGLQS